MCVDVIVCVLGVAIFYVCPPSFFLIQNSRPSRMVPRVCRNILYGNVKFWIPQNMLYEIKEGVFIRVLCRVYDILRTFELGPKHPLAN